MNMLSNNNVPFQKNIWNIKLYSFISMNSMLQNLENHCFACRTGLYCYSASTTLFRLKYNLNGRIFCWSQEHNLQVAWGHLIGRRYIFIKNMTGLDLKTPTYVTDLVHIHMMLEPVINKVIVNAYAYAYFALGHCFWHATNRGQYGS